MNFVDLETQYFNVLDGVLGIAVPMVTTILPAIPKLKLWMKARMGRYKSYEVKKKHLPLSRFTISTHALLEL